jgi:hypothetical protein
MVRGNTLPEAKISGQVIIDQLIRNMELGQFEMAYTVLLPCIFSIYLHPDDYARLASVLDLIREDAKRALSSRMEQLNAKPSRFKVKRSTEPRKHHRIAFKDWVLEFFPDSEGAVPLGDVEIHSELNETAQPGYAGVKTTLMDRVPSVNEASSGHAIVPRDPGETRKALDRVYAEIRYEDDSGPQLYIMTQDEISIGRGGDDLQVSLPLYTNDEVSREHALLRRDPLKGSFVIVDKSRNGTWLNGKRLAKGVEQDIPDRAQIGVAEVLTLHFEAKR